MSQFIEIFYGMETTPVKDYIDDSFPGEWGTEDKDGNGVKVIRTTNFTNSGKLNLADVVTRSIEDRKVVRKQIKKYDTILERSGGTADNPVGRVVLFEEDNLFLCNNFTQVLRFKDVDPRFAFYALYYFYQTNRTAIRSMGSKTTGIQNLNMSKYLEIGIPNASDEDQKAFVTIAEQADKSEFVGCKSQFFEMFEGDEYPLIKLGDYTDLTWGDTNTTKNSYVTEGYLAYSASGPDGKLDHYDYDCEGIVLSAIGADCGKTWFASGKWSCIKNTIRFWSTFDDLDNRFLYFATREKDFWPRRGGAQPFIPQGDARNCSIPLPPICLQRKFVEIAEQADKSEFVGCKSQFIEMFGNPVTNYKKWETQPIQEIAPEKPSNDLQEGNVWLLNLDMIEPNTGHIIEKVYVDSKELLSVSPFDEGNVLFSKLRPYLNKVVIPNGKGYATTELLPLRPNGKKLNRTFFSYLLRSDEFVTYANSIATGTKMPRMPLTSLRKFECILPPMEQQQQFVAIAEQADKSEYYN